jgi:hypothetical protein
MWGRKRAPKNSQQYQLFTEKMAEMGSVELSPQAIDLIIVIPA